VCVSAVQTCVSGSFVDCVPADYGPDFQLVETKCDGLDNDCDGLVDQSPLKAIAQNVTGNWELFAYPDGVALVALVPSSANPNKLDLEVMRFDALLNPLMPTPVTVVATVDPGTNVAARNDASDVWVVWNAAGAFNLKVVALEGTVRSLGQLAGSTTGLIELGLSPTQAVTTFRISNDVGAIFWPRDGGAVSTGFLSDQLVADAGTISHATSSLASQGGHYFAFAADVDTLIEDGGTQTNGVYVVYSADSQRLISAGTFPGYQGAAVLEQPFGKLISLYDDYFNSPFGFIFPSYSGIYQVDLLQSAGSRSTIIESTDYTVYQNVELHAAATSNGALFAHMNNSTAQVVVTSQNTGGLRRSVALESDAGYGSPRVAWDTTNFLAVGFESGGTIFARRLCSP
jgi:hypothetical protein